MTASASDRPLVSIVGNVCNLDLGGVEACATVDDARVLHAALGNALRECECECDDALDGVAPCRMCGDALSCIDTASVEDDDGLYAVECDCGVRGPRCKSEAGAIAQWNLLMSLR